MQHQPLLEFDAVRIGTTGQRAKSLVHDISFSVGKGERVGIVGESGSGKSLSCLSVMGLLTAGLAVTSGEIRFDGTVLTQLPTAKLRQYRGNRFSMVYQEPLTSLNPLMRVGAQVAEAIRDGKPSRERVRAALDEVGIKNAERVMQQYPHELSGGMRQRVMIAAAMISGPQLLLADEPTTALDATIQNQVLRLMYDLSVRTDTAILLVSHDLHAVAKLVDRVIVMREGRIVETGSTAQVLASPQHPYTKMLIHSAPKLGHEEARLAGSAAGEQLAHVRGEALHIVERDEPATSAAPQAILEIEHLDKEFKLPGKLFERRPTLHAVRDLSVSVERGTTLGVVGETGSGKSTLANMIMGLVPPTSGEVRFRGESLRAKRSKGQRRAMQMVFQDPYSSLNPRMRVKDIIAEPLRAHGMLSGIQLDRRIATLLDMVRMPQEAADRFPHEFSGGQRQRIVIARALALDPELLICDEAVSALDVSMQSQVLNLLKDLQDELGLTYVFIGHGLETVYFMSDHVMVMYHGDVVESAPVAQLYADPQHEYTKQLLRVAGDQTPFSRSSDSVPRVVEASTQISS